MVFSSMTFLCAFFPLCAIAYFICKNRTYRNAVLLVFSLGFYAWGEPVYLLLMLGATFVAYIGGRLIDRWRGKKLAKAAFVLTVAALVASLAVFKYLNFAVDSINQLIGAALEIRRIALPIGISFFTFQILSYVIDLYWGKIGLQRNPFDLLLYVCFFPQLIAGPIVRYETIELELRDRSESVDQMAAGFRRFVAGLGKKVILADNVAKIFTAIYAGGTAGGSDYGTAAYWLAALSYTMHIYFGFSGYSDMAIGLGQIFGFHFLENFNYPYISKSVTEFWRRWHISLSGWFRDYIYIPLGGSRTSKGKWIRNILVVWSLTGLWHGASWNFVVWGLYFAALLLLEKLLLNWLLERLPKFVRWLYTFILINIGWVIFNLTDFHDMMFALGKMFTWAPTDFCGVIFDDSAILTALFYLVVSCVLSVPVKNWLEKRVRIPVVVRNVACLGLFLLCFVYILSTTFHPFIYFRF